MKRMLKHSWIDTISAIYCSDEQKAKDGAQMLAGHTGLSVAYRKELGENDRSATGFLEPAEFEATADAFFSSPETSVRGWETARAAQKRIVDAVNRIDRDGPGSGAIAIVSHGAVGTLLYCYLSGQAINRKWDQPGSGGGNYLKIARGVCNWWVTIDL